MDKIQKIRTAGLSTIQNLSAPIADIAIKLQVISPEWGLAVSMGAGLLAVWRELAEDRGVELLNFVERHKTEFAENIIETPSFKATFLNVWEMHIRENSENKRKRLRNFLLSLGRGKEIDPDIHTKIYAVIEQMTDKEAEIFGFIFRNSNREMFNKMHLNTTSIPEAKEYPEEVLQDACNSLHAYRLITVSDATIGAIMTIKQITPFGELFYDFVCKE